jgi:hypothetical protein
MVVMAEGGQSPDREFIFAANLARLLKIGTIRCVATELKLDNSRFHVVLPGGFGEQTFPAGGGAAPVFNMPHSRLDGAHEWASRHKHFERVARSLGVSFGGYERATSGLETVARQFASDTIVIAAAAHRSGSFEKNSIGQRLVSPGAARVVFCPARPIAYQRIIVDASDPRLSELLHWGYDWSRHLNSPLYLIAGARAAAGRAPWLTRVFDWLGLEARIRPTQCSVAMLRNELKPADLLLTSINGSTADPIASFGCRISEILANAPCAVGALPLDESARSEFAKAVGGAWVRDKNFLLNVTFSA